MESLKIRDLESRYLTQSSDFEGSERLSNFVEENNKVEIPVSKFHISAPISSSCIVLPSSFSLQATLGAETSPSPKSSKEARVKLTEKYRKAALKAKEPKSLQDLAVKVE